MTNDRQLADVESIAAHQTGALLIIVISGKKPTPCHKVGLERSLLTEEPPTFHAFFEQDPGVICVQVVTPYTYWQAFLVGSPRETIDVQTSEGKRSVNVVQGKIGMPGLAASEIRGVVEHKPSETVGFSKSYDLGEAIKDAIDQLPPPPEIPDWLSRYEVLSITVERGGIANLDHLAVRLKGV